MRGKIDVIVIFCIVIAVYINLTDFPKSSRTVNGQLIKLGVKE